MKRDYSRVPLQIYLILLGFIFLFRIQFWFFNRAYITFHLIDFVRGLHFDMSLVGYLALFSLPLFYLIGLIKNQKWWKFSIYAVSGFLFLPCLITESWDLIYFQYTLKRSSMDMYYFFGRGDDFIQLHSLLSRFWYIPLMVILWSILFFTGIWWFIRRVKQPHELKKNVLILFSAMALFFLLARHSFDLKPLGILDATVFDAPERSQLVLNSPFVVLKTMHNEPLGTTQWINSSLEKKYCNPITLFETDYAEQKPNLVFIILESFGANQVGQKKGSTPITPFLDSLFFKDSTTMYVPGCANGKTSIECLPALFAGIPSLMEVPFELSNFSTNRINAFPAIASQKGYRTLFFHGAQSGSMRFEATASKLGFQERYFKDNFQGSPASTGSWGYHDEVVLNSMLRTLNNVRQPFLSAIFTLSSHEPFDIPQKKIVQYSSLNKEQAAYKYTDDCLRDFFHKAKKQPWFANTIFIITGDHTPVHLDQNCRKIEDYYKVPIAIVHGPANTKLPREHLQIVPWICHSLDWDVQLYSYGTLQNQEKIRYLNGIYHIWNDNYYLQFNENTSRWKYSWRNKIDQTALEIIKLKLLATLQRFRKDLRYNKLMV